MNTPSVIFYVGKGGTGKSTVSAITAMTLAKEGNQVMVASLDAAHNLSDIFQTRLHHKPKRVAPNLLAAEIDRERMIQAFLKETRDSIKQTYSYLTAFNLDSHFNILKFSPGLEEYALVKAFTQLLEKYSDLDYLILDMPPTALSLKIFTLPTLSRTWIEQLENLRNEINKKKEIVATVRYGKKEHGRDKILNRIKAMKEYYINLESIFRNPETTTISVVANNDTLSVSETQRTVSDLKTSNIHIKSVVWNRVDTPSGLPGFNLPGKAAPLCVPPSKTPLTGIEALNTFINTWDVDGATLVGKVVAP
jgi:arsenite-transporting ATPase